MPIPTVNGEESSMENRKRKRSSCKGAPGLSIIGCWACLQAESKFRNLAVKEMKRKRHKGGRKGTSAVFRRKKG